MNLFLGEGMKVGSTLFPTLLGQEQQMEDFLPSWFPHLSYLRKPTAYSRINGEYFSFKARSPASQLSYPALLPSSD